MADSEGNSSRETLRSSDDERRAERAAIERSERAELLSDSRLDSYPLDPAPESYPLETHTSPQGGDGSTVNAAEDDVVEERTASEDADGDRDDERLAEEAQQGSQGIEEELNELNELMTTELTFDEFAGAYTADVPTPPDLPTLVASSSEASPPGTPPPVPDLPLPQRSSLVPPPPRGPPPPLQPRGPPPPPPPGGPAPARGGIPPPPPPPPPRVVAPGGAEILSYVRSRDRTGSIFERRLDFSGGVQVGGTIGQHTQRVAGAAERIMIVSDQCPSYSKK